MNIIIIVDRLIKIQHTLSLKTLNTNSKDSAENLFLSTGSLYSISVTVKEIAPPPVGSEAKSGADLEQIWNRWEQEEIREEQKGAEASRRGERDQRGLNERAKQHQPPSLHVACPPSGCK